jgi:hypothetical protein
VETATYSNIFTIFEGTSEILRGLAVNLGPEAEAAAHSGISGREWMDGPGRDCHADQRILQAQLGLGRAAGPAFG